MHSVSTCESICRVTVFADFVFLWASSLLFWYWVGFCFAALLMAVQNSPTNNITMHVHSPDFSKSGFYFDLLNAKRSAFIFVWFFFFALHEYLLISSVFLFDLALCAAIFFPFNTSCFVILVMFLLSWYCRFERFF